MARSIYVYGGPSDVTSADLNGDGLTDLLVPQSDSFFDRALQRYIAMLSIYYGDAQGRFSPGPRLTATGIVQMQSVAVADFNGDGRQDIAGVAGNEPEARVFLARGAANGGGFNDAVSFNMTPVNGYGFPRSLLAVDLNKDGKPDLIGVTDSQLMVALNTSTTGALNFAAPLTILLDGQSFRGLTDVNGDGVSEISTVTESRILSL
jgi:hypothetical protein